MRRADLTVHVSTKLNRSHVVHRPRGADPARARPQREGPHRRPRAAGHRRGLDVRGARLAGSARAGLARTCGPRSTSSAASREATLGADAPGPVGGAAAPTTPRSAAAIARVVPGCEAYDEKVDQPGGFVLPHPPRDSRTFPTDVGQGDVHGQPDRRAARARRAGCCCRRCARTTSSTPRSTASTTATAGSPAAAAWCSCTPTTSPRSGSTDGDHGRPGQRVGGRLRAAGRRRSGSSPTTSRAAARRRTTPRPTRWCPLDSRAEGSNCPTSKSVIVRLGPDRAGRQRRSTRRASAATSGTREGSAGRQRDTTRAPTARVGARLMTNPERDPDELVLDPCAAADERRGAARRGRCRSAGRARCACAGRCRSGTAR